MTAAVTRLLWRVREGRSAHAVHHDLRIARA
jgi:hypothetical protein